MSILVTGGAGYIGSHACLELLQCGHDVVVIDNLSNSKSSSLDRVQQLAKRSLSFYEADLLDQNAIYRVFCNEKIEAVIHFAGLKAVGESVSNPVRYYENNISGTINLCKTMKEFEVKRLVFSSSATVYGNPAAVPISEDFPLAPTNPYGWTKLMIENILSDIYNSDNLWSVAILRYFNPVGAHNSGYIGEDPSGTPNNLVPYIAQVAVEKLPKLLIFGDDYPTIDGTGVRDYIHVVDLAEGHLKALEKVTHPGLHVFNLGTGRGYSVFEVLNAFEKACGKKIPYEVVGRRPGDAPESYANPGKAKTHLGWQAKRNLFEMCVDAWNWQSNNPSGY